MNVLIKWVLPLVESAGEVALIDLLQKMHDTNVKSYTQLLGAVYPAIDVQLENYTKTTKTVVDDRIVNKLKTVLEQSAVANGVVLPNIDFD